MPFTLNRRAENSTSAAAASRSQAAIRAPFSTIWSDAFAITTAASRRARAECAPPPTTVTSVSPVTRFTCGQLHAEPLDDELREARRVSLAGRERAEHHVDRSLGAHRDVRALAREPGIELDVVRHADPAIAAAPARLGAAGLEPRPVREGHRTLLGGQVVATVVECADGVPVRHRARGHEVPPPELEPVESVPLRGEVDQPLHDEHDLGASRAAVRRGRGRVRGDGAPMHRHGGDAIDRGRDRHALVERVERDDVGADVAGVGAAKREEGAVGVERELGLHREIAALIVGEECLAPLARPLHGPAEAPRRPGDQRELRIAAIAGPEVSAHLARHHAHRALRDAERAGHAGLCPSEAARAGVNGVAAARGVPDADRRARLHRHAGDALHPRVEPHHVGRARERQVHGRGVADLAIHADVRGSAVVEDRRVRAPRRRCSPSRRAAASSRRPHARRHHAPPRTSRR